MFGGWQSARLRRGLRLAIIASTLASCGRQDGVVGVERLSTGGDGAAGTPSARGFTDDFSENSGFWTEQARVDGAATAFGVPGALARDGNLAELRFPGHPEYGPSDRVGASYATEIATNERFGFGTYRTRLAYGACDSSEETVLSFLGYFNDGSDHDGDGIVDDLEIDMQVICGQPRLLYLTVYTDDDGDAGTRFRKLSRVIDFSSGEHFDTTSVSSDAFESTGDDPALIWPDWSTPGSFYELGFEWHTDSIRFFVKLGNSERDVWTLSGAERVPQQPVYVLYNLWHPDLHWYPGKGAADYPANDVVLSVDWVSFEPE